MYETAYDLSGARKHLGRVALAMGIIVVLSTLAQLLISALLELFPVFDGFVKTHYWLEWILSLIPLYGCAIPPALMLLKTVPEKKPQRARVKALYFLEFIPICIFLMYTGSLLGQGLSYVVTGGTATNPVEEYLTDNNLLKVISVVILAPLVEEYVFRKQIIDRALPYGEKWAILLSAVAFGLMHQNIFQFFYAAGLGLLLGYVYVRTGCLWYTIALHGIVNFMGGVIAPWMLQVSAIAENGAESVGAKEAILLLIASAYSMALIGLFFFGLVRLIVRCKQLVWFPGEKELPKGKGFPTVFLNPSMILYTLICVGIMVLSLLNS